MQFSIIIATCGRPQRLATSLRCVESAVTRFGGTHTVVVADNGPGYPAEQVADEFRRGSGIETIYLRTVPKSKSAALNAGIAAAASEWLAFTDDDTMADADWLTNAAAFLATTQLRACGGRVVAGEGRVPRPSWLRPGPAGVLPHGGAIVEYDPLTSSGALGEGNAVPFGANFFAHRDVFREHGRYDEELWDLCGNAAVGVEDGEVGVRFRRRGESIGYCREAVVVHALHGERFSIGSHMRVGYRYGWRDPFVFFDPGRPALEPYNLRLLARLLLSSPARWARRDPAAAVADLVEGAKCVGRMRGRLSRSYRTWAQIQAHRASEPGGSA